MAGFDEFPWIGHILLSEFVEALCKYAKGGRPVPIRTTTIQVIMNRISPPPNPEQLQQILDNALLGARKQGFWDEAAKYLAIWWAANRMWGESLNKA